MVWLHGPALSGAYKLDGFRADVSNTIRLAQLFALFLSVSLYILSYIPIENKYTLLA